LKPALTLVCFGLQVINKILVTITSLKKELLFVFVTNGLMMKKFILPEAPLTFGDLTIDPANRLVRIVDKIVVLGRKELEILILLTKRAGDIVTRENILNVLYENADMYDRTVDSHMSHLRKKIREVAGENLQINSVYGLGYRLNWKS
jgi:DNA-binding response OmpR family regulator